MFILLYFEQSRQRNKMRKKISYPFLSFVFLLVPHSEPSVGYSDNSPVVFCLVFLHHLHFHIFLPVRYIWGPDPLPAWQNINNFKGNVTFPCIFASLYRGLCVHPWVFIGRLEVRIFFKEKTPPGRIYHHITLSKKQDSSTNIKSQFLYALK